MNSRWGKLATSTEVRLAAGCTALFAAAAWKADLKIAAAVVLALIAGMFLHFEMIRPGLSWLRGGPKPTPREFALGTFGIVVGGLLVHFGYGIVLAFWYGAALVIDASLALERMFGSR